MTSLCSKASLYFLWPEMHKYADKHEVYSSFGIVLV